MSGPLKPQQYGPEEDVRSGDYPPCQLAVFGQPLLSGCLDEKSYMYGIGEMLGAPDPERVVIG